MARLWMQHNILEMANDIDVKQRRSLRLMARYHDNALSMPDDEFQANYRLSKLLFEELCADLEPLIPKPKRRSDISSKYKILVTLSFYATGSYQRLIGGTHGTLMSQQSVSRAIRDVTAALNSQEILRKYIKFPQTQPERTAIKTRFYEKFGFPAIVGCIDGTHVAIIRPAENEERFFNRKHFHSRNVLVICDSDLNILCVDASFGGASHDSFVWNQHPVKQHLVELTNGGERVYLLEDSGYAQRKYMMTPIVNAAADSPEGYYNQKHCTARNTVERTIGVLKSRWRCLLGHRVLHYHPEVAGYIINACCVLHNLCNKENLNTYYDSDSVPTEESETSMPPYHNSNPAADLRRGIEARANLVRELWCARR